MNSVRLGIIGFGNMGGGHFKYIGEGKVNRCQVTAVVDEDPARLTSLTGVKTFTNLKDMLAAKCVDAVLIATPHYSHTPLAIAALKAGLHVLVEKPLAVHKADCQRMIAAYKRTQGQVFCEMFNQRTDPSYIKLREMVRSGELGEIRRINWIITNWYRTEAYYASGGWRATWAGEGGGVLLNQCPHNIDLYQWIFGLPARVRAFCTLGRYHDIEVEDDVTAYFEYKNGTTAVFVTSTGEAPGTNRLEITAENGRVVYEAGKITWRKNEVPMTKFSHETKTVWSTPPNTEIVIPIEGTGGQHAAITQNFVDAILDGTPLVAQAVEGINSVELANAMLYSSLTKKTVDLPLNAAAYEKTLQGLIKKSRFKKKTVKVDTNADFSKSYSAK